MAQVGVGTGIQEGKVMRRRDGMGDFNRHGMKFENGLVMRTKTQGSSVTARQKESRGWIFGSVAGTHV